MTDYDETYSLKIEAYTPGTIPMVRFAAYVAVLAGLLGESKSVHFQALSTGSTQIACTVEREAAYKVALRIAGVESASQKAPEGRAYRDMKRLLLEDSAGACLRRNGENILIFPAIRMQDNPLIDPFWENIAHVGVLMSVGGRDETAHAVIQNIEGTHWSFAVDHNLAMRLSGYLYGTPIRLIGKGKRSRDETGLWKEENLVATHFEVLENAGWKKSIDALRALPDMWPEDTMEALVALRDEDTEAW